MKINKNVFFLFTFICFISYGIGVKEKTNNYLLKNNYSSIVSSNNINYKLSNYNCIFFNPDNNQVTDIDQNVYNTIQIGTQTWIQSNLNVSRYNNGDIIPQVTDPTQWVNITTGAWCYYNYNSSNGSIYGKLYNWYAVNDPRGLAPQGWHIPNDVEWNYLKTFLGGEKIAGGKMKETGISHWLNPNTGATNVSDFNGLPSGFCFNFGKFDYQGKHSYWWSSTEEDASYAWCINLLYNNPKINTYKFLKTYGFSIRCIQN